MSKTRTNTSRQENALLKQYRNQRKTTLFDRPKAYQPSTNFRMGSGLFSTFILLNVLFAAGREAFAQAAPTAGNHDIEKLALARLRTDPLLTDTKSRRIKCDKLPTLIAGIAEKNSEAEIIIRKLLMTSELVIYCSDTETITNRVEGHAYFDPNHNTITLDSDLIDESNVVHEFIHAHFFFQQKSNPNPTDPNTNNNGKMVSPLLKVTEAEAKKYIALLDKGYERVLQFEKLLTMHRKHKPMTKAQTDRLKKFLDATKNCLTTTNVSQITHRDLAILGSEGFLNGRIFTNDIDGSTLKFIKVIENKKDVTVFAALQEPHDALISQIKNFRNMQKQGTFKNIFLEAAECDAYAFMTLDATAAKFLFPEAKAVRDEMIKACDDERAVRMSREL